LNASAPFKSPQARERYLEHLASRALQWPVASEERIVATSFGDTFVRISGPSDGAPVLLLPGIGSTGLTLAPTVRGLSGPRRTFVIDNIHDVGRSIERRTVTSADDFAAWLDEVRAGLALETVDLLGLSYGGWIVGQYALRFPQRVGSLVLLAPAGTIAPLPWAFIWRAVLCALPARRFLANFMNWVGPGLRAMPGGEALIEDMVEDGLLAAKSFGSRRMVAPIPLTDAAWSALAVDTLFLAGNREVIFDANRALEKLKRVAPRVDAELIAGASHDFFLTHEADVNDRVLRFLARASR
jgi:pimeloyl-ACP methyl ester carboxylesterase